MAQHLAVLAVSYQIFSTHENDHSATGSQLLAALEAFHQTDEQ